MALSKNRIKYIHSLEQKKHRKAEGVFLAEGPKLINDLLGKFACPLLVATAEWLSAHPHPDSEEIIEATEEELTRASLLCAPQQVLAVFRHPQEAADFAAPTRSLCLALDGVQDPGNLGTVIRLADWFGIEHVFCSPDTVDVYNPKVIQSTMGAIARVAVHYTSLSTLINGLPAETPVYGTFLNGQNIYKQKLSKHGLIIMGNEGNGIKVDIEKLVTYKLHIPNYPAGREASESLNVAIATAIACAEFRRQASSL